MGFIFGVLLGAVAALLYAPKPGDSTREELQLRADELKKRADELQRIAQRIADDVAVKGREIVEDAKRQWESTSGRAGGTGGTGTTGGSASKS